MDSIHSKVSRIPNFLNKALPETPPSAIEDNLKLRKRTQLLEEVIEILYKQNLQYASILNNYKLFEKESRRAAENLAKAASDSLSSSRQHHSIMKTLERQAKSEWDDYCEEKNTGHGVVVDQILEELKERMVDRDCEEIFIKFSKSAKD
ncbi:hypothetical protein BDZ45DRAFT_781500 [Acephala macrosclerotiorum]|nr:hypothetical protein BDZ45DRAFT_781500 [Acephala macrosclerotiorum]